MKRALVIALLYIAAPLKGQELDLQTLRQHCIPYAPADTLRAIVTVESRGNPNAMQIDFPNALLKRWALPSGSLRLKRQPSTTAEARSWLAYFQQYQIFVDVGLMQVSTAEALRRGIPAQDLFEPCTNLRVGWTILQDAYAIEARKYGPGQLALDHAISRYNTGNTQRGIDNGYLSRVLAAVRGTTLLSRK